MAQKHDDIAFIDLVREAWPFFMSNLMVTIGAPAIQVLVPTVVVAFPTCVLAVIVGVCVGFINRGLILWSEAPVGIAGTILFVFAYGFLRAGWVNIVLKMMRGEPYSLGELKLGMPWLMNMAAAMFLVGLGTAIGSAFIILLAAPGIFFAVRTSFVPFLVVDQNMGPIEALKKSNEMVTGYSWQMLGFIAISGFIHMVAGLIPLVGSVAAIGFGDVLLGRLYFYRLGEDVEMPE